MNRRDLDSLIRGVVRRELSPVRHQAHPDLDTVLAALASDAPEEVRGALVAHVATCPLCEKRWRAVERTLAARLDRLEVRAGGAQLAELVREHDRRERNDASPRGRLGVLRLGPVLRPVLVPVVAAVAAVGIGLGTALPIVLSRTTSSADRLALVAQEIKSLRATTESLALAVAQAGGSIPATILRPGVSAEDLVGLKNEAGQISDPWQRALYVASQLNRWGVEPSALLDWGSLSAHTVRAGDTWETLAACYLGERSSWPLLWLLNGAPEPVNRDLEIGTTILIPSSAK